LFLAHKELGDLLCHAGEYDAAIGHYNEALRLRPNFPEAQDNLAFARSLAGR
jgi:tetratricopeptide (TPR) repeat protein